jgi:flagellar biosynthetic protein FliR
VPVVSQFYIIVITLMFFTLNGHLAVVDVLVDSFRSLPISPAGLSTDNLWSLVGWGTHMYAGGVQIALPAIASILLINLTFAVVTRSAPQFNIFSIGFPVTIIMGFFIIMATLTTVIPHFERQLAAAFSLIRVITGGS